MKQYKTQPAKKIDTLDHNRVTSIPSSMVGKKNSKHPDVKDGQGWNYPTGKKSQNDRPEK